MALKFQLAQRGEICLIQQDETGRILQIGLTLEQSKMLQHILASMSNEQQFVKMSEEHDLVLKITADKNMMKFGNWLLNNKNLMIDQPNKIRKPMQMLLKEFNKENEEL